MATFGAKAGLDAAQIHSLVHGGSDDACWPAEDRDLLRLCDALHAECTIDDALWQSLRARFTELPVLDPLHTQAELGSAGQGLTVFGDALVSSGDGRPRGRAYSAVRNIGDRWCVEE